jgi:hypothetical protein
MMSGDGTTSGPCLMLGFSIWVLRVWILMQEVPAYDSNTRGS